MWLIFLALFLFISLDVYGGEQSEGRDIENHTLRGVVVSVSGKGAKVTVESIGNPECDATLLEASNGATIKLSPGFEKSAKIWVEKCHITKPSLKSLLE